MPVDLKPAMRQTSLSKLATLIFQSIFDLMEPFHKLFPFAKVGIPFLHTHVVNLSMVTKAR